MPTALEILNDPNYINANEATKRAIFDRHVASSPDYQNANAQTQDQIRRRFQITPSTPAQRYLGVPEPVAPRAPSTPAERYMRPQERRGVSMTPDQRQRERANPTPTVSREAAVLSGLERAVAPVVNFATALNPPMAQEGIPYRARVLAEQGLAQREADNAARAQIMQQQRPQSFGGGRLVGDIAVTAPILAAGGGLLAAGGRTLSTAAPRTGAFLEQFGTSAASAGLGTGRTAAETAAIPLVERAGHLGVRMLGGGTAGATAAGITGQDVSEGFQFGAGLPVVGSLVRNLTGRVVDLGRMPALAAARILRESLENNVDRARELFAQMSPGDRRLAEQVMIEAGIEPRPFFGVGRTVQEQISPTQFAQRLEEQAAAREAGLAQAAGGNTIEEMRASARQGRADVTREMTPQLLAAQERAGYASQVVPGMLREADAASAQADELTASGIVPRMRGLEERTLGQIGDVFEHPELYAPGTAGRQLPRLGEIADQSGRRADEAIDAQLGLRARVRDIHDEINDMAAQGLQPIEAGPVIASIERTLRVPEVRVDDVRAGILQGIVDKLRLATDRNGMLDVSALGRIRQTSINDVVERITRQISAGGAPSSGASQRGASAALEMRDMIDNLIREGGGGQQYTDYLTRSQAGYASVNRGELAGEAFRLYKDDPQSASAFLALVRGDRPETVYSVMGGGPANESFSGVMASDPQRLLPIQNAAREMETLNRMGELRGQGAASANNILRQARPGTVVRGLAATGLSPFPVARISLSGGGQIADKMEGQMIRQAQQRLSDAYFNPQSMSRLLNTFSTGSRVGEQISNIPRVYRNAMVQGALPSGVPEGGMVFGYGVTEDGQQYPMIEMPDGRIIHQTPAGNR